MPSHGNDYSWSSPLLFKITIHGQHNNSIMYKLGLLLDSKQDLGEEIIWMVGTEVNHIKTSTTHIISQENFKKTDRLLPHSNKKV